MTVFAIFVALLTLFEALLGGTWWVAGALICLPHEMLLVPAIVLLLMDRRKRNRRGALTGLTVTAWILFFLCSFTVPLPASQPPDGQRLAVLTFNIESAPEGSAPIRAAINGSGADLVCLQEANPWNVDAEMVPPGWHKAVGAGMAILSRHPIESLREVETAQPEPGRTRPALLATVRIGERKVSVLSVHYTLFFHGVPGLGRPWEISDAFQERGHETRTLLSLIADIPRPLVMAGDFNGPPRDREARAFRGSLIDAFAMRGFGFGHTFDSDTPLVRIDSIKVSPDIFVETARVLSYRGSDHLPLFAHLVVPR